MRSNLTEVIGIVQNGFPFATENDLDKVRNFCRDAQEDIDNDDPVLRKACEVACQKGFREEELTRSILPTLKSWKLLWRDEIRFPLVTFMTYWVEAAEHSSFHLSSSD